MSTGVIEVGPHFVQFPDVGAAFSKAMTWFGGNLPDAQKVWDSGDRYTPILAILDRAF